MDPSRMKVPLQSKEKQRDTESGKRGDSLPSVVGSLGKVLSRGLRVDS
jgi:hypothetical protein